MDGFDFNREIQKRHEQWQQRYAEMIARNVVVQDLIRDSVHRGERLEGILDCSVVGDENSQDKVYMFAITSRRVIYYYKHFIGSEHSMLSIPHSKILQLELKMDKEHKSTSRLELLLPSAREHYAHETLSVTFHSASDARKAHDLILAYLT